ncbi:30S ribosomal protein S7 [Microgenomates group bacterium RBG_19FT_COMBO_39_10]|nr:MAG: 30S ribosomal protein S7 [Microgenomates group bacterium RBG_19FT_COMBO_39_10]
MRGKKAPKRTVIPDEIYKSRLVTKLINRTMRQGKKSVAQKHVYQAFKLIEEKTKSNPLEVFHQALENVKPQMEVRPRRVGGAAYQVPIPVKGDRRESLAIRWLIQAAQARPSKEYHHFYEKLAVELIEAAKKEGGAVAKKEEINKIAEANKAFAHFRW